MWCMDSNRTWSAGPRRKSVGRIIRSAARSKPRRDSARSRSCSSCYLEIDDRKRRVTILRVRPGAARRARRRRPSAGSRAGDDGGEGALERVDVQLPEQADCACTVLGRCARAPTGRGTTFDAARTRAAPGHSCRAAKSTSRRHVAAALRAAMPASPASSSWAGPTQPHSRLGYPRRSSPALPAIAIRLRPTFRC